MSARLITLWSNSTRITKLVDEALSDIAPRGKAWSREVSRGYTLKPSTGPRDLPTAVLYVVTATKVSAGIERFAVTRGGMPLVLPEGGDYLLKRVQRAIADGEVVVLLGADLRPRVK